VEKALAMEEPIKIAPPEPKKEPRKQISPIIAKSVESEQQTVPISSEEPAQKVVPKKSDVAPSVPSTPGRGGGQHKYLQQLIKRLAEEKGYKATIEGEVLGGVGSVDVSLEKAEFKIACEISITTSDEHEMGNIQKCIASGYDQVVMISQEKKVLTKLRRLAEDALEKKSFTKVVFLTPEGFVSFLEESDAKAATTERTVKGYKVKVKYKAMGEDEKKSRRDAISQVVLKAVKRLKGKD
jgi:hypothetical protein